MCRQAFNQKVGNMHSYAIDTIIPVLYLGISAGCLFLARRAYTTRTLIFKKGIKGMELENSEYLRWVQIISTLFLGIVMLSYAWISGYTLYSKIMLI